jgi:hypothetical protein
VDLQRWVKNQWDRAGAILAALLGLLSLLIGWLGVRDATLPTQQIPYLASAGLLGLFALGIAATLWLSADLRDEWRKLDDIHRDIQAGNAGSSAASGPDPSVTPRRRATRGSA